MIWNKLGLIHFPSETINWAQDTMLQPTPLLLDDDIIRVFTGMRDKEGRSRVGYIDLCAKNPLKILNVSKRPCLDLGDPGMFDDNGVVPCAVVHHEDEFRLYYAGYNLCKNIRFTVFSGLAISRDNGLSFKRLKRTPILERTNDEPLFRVIHSVINHNGDYKVWYGSGSSFSQGQSKTLPVYNVKSMDSSDGLIFPETNTVSVDIKDKEHRIGRPYVLKLDESKYIMFYGYGSEEKPYNLGLAISSDGVDWQRKDELFKFNSELYEWESNMQAYPSVITACNKTYLFYNGNSYGQDGIGCAVLDGSLYNYFR